MVVTRAPFLNKMKEGMAVICILALISLQGVNKRLYNINKYRSSININFDEGNIGQCLGEGLELGCHGTARSTPGGIEINGNLEINIQHNQ